MRTINLNISDIANALALKQCLAWLPRPMVLDAVDRMQGPVRYCLGVTLSLIMAGEQGWGVPADFGARN